MEDVVPLRPSALAGLTTPSVNAIKVDLIPANQLEVFCGSDMLDVVAKLERLSECVCVHMMQVPA